MNKKITFYNVKLHKLPPGDMEVRFDFLIGVGNFPFIYPEHLFEQSLNDFRSFCTNFNLDDTVKAKITIEVLDE